MANNVENSYMELIECGVWQCLDCGAFAKEKGEIVHHASCIPGEAAKWAEEQREAI